MIEKIIWFLLVVLSSGTSILIFLRAIKIGEILECYTLKVLEPLYKKNSPWYKVLGGCQFCFSFWASCLLFIVWFISSWHLGYLFSSNILMVFLEFYLFVCCTVVSTALLSKINF